MAPNVAKRVCEVPMPVIVVWVVGFVRYKEPLVAPLVALVASADLFQHFLQPSIIPAKFQQQTLFFFQDFYWLCIEKCY